MFDVWKEQKLNFLNEHKNLQNLTNLTSEKLKDENEALQRVEQNLVQTNENL